MPVSTDMGRPSIEVRRFGDRHYAYEREAYWDPALRQTRRRTLRYLGPCDATGHLLSPPKVQPDAIHSAFPVGPLAVFYAAAKQLKVRDRIGEVLGVSDDRAGHLLTLALNQATARVPLSRLHDWVRASPLPRWESLTPDTLTPRAFEDALSALCHLTPEKTWEDRGLLLQDDLTRAWRGRSRESPAVYYDITKQSYAGSSCPYAQRGHDSNGGISPVVGFGMVVSRDHHHPYLCRALPGAQNDTLSVAETVEMLQARGYTNLTLVMDRGMTSAGNVARAVRAGYHVVGLVKGWDDETVALASRWPGEDLERPEHVVVTSHGGAVYARALTTPLAGRSRMRVAVVENLGRKADDREGRDLALQELEGPVSRERLMVLRRELAGLLVTNRGRRGFRADSAAVERDRKLDGRFLLFSTDPSMDGRTMYRTYFQRDAIEKVFRTSKGEMSLGPVRYRRKDRVDAYATVVYMAYLLWSWAERRLREKYPRMTLEEALRIVENVSWVRFGSGKLVREWPTRLTEEQEAVLSPLGAKRYLPCP